MNQPCEDMTSAIPSEHRSDSATSPQQMPAPASLPGPTSTSSPSTGDQKITREDTPIDSHEQLHTHQALADPDDQHNPSMGTGQDKMDVDEDAVPYVVDTIGCQTTPKNIDVEDTVPYAIDTIGCHISPKDSDVEETSSVPADHEDEDQNNVDQTTEEQHQDVAMADADDDEAEEPYERGRSPTRRYQTPDREASTSSTDTNDPLGDEVARSSQSGNSPKSNHSAECEHTGNCSGSPGASTPPASPAPRHPRSKDPAKDSKALQQHRYLHEKAKTVLPPEKHKPSRYWIGVLSPTVAPKDIRKERDLIWMKGNKVSHLTAIGHLTNVKAHHGPYSLEDGRVPRRPERGL